MYLLKNRQRRHQIGTKIIQSREKKTIIKEKVKARKEKKERLKLVLVTVEARLMV